MIAYDFIRGGRSMNATMMGSKAPISAAFLATLETIAAMTSTDEVSRPPSGDAIRWRTPTS
ncbi:hypothetical protein [Novosphingobium kaempferiae]|uniref:hypothetical protein n=1 Tax=Novosphingobium kaempferiae TaxID=2896849 RepID=UPI001E2CC5B2|nr:hypothetical protein [Novosphingobium kaempferiae]